MRKTLIALALLVPLAATAGGPPHGERMEHVMKELDLTDTQQQQMKEIFKRHHERFTQLREDTEAEVSKILTPEQREKLDRMKKDRKEKWEERKSKKKDKDRHHDHD